MEVRQHAALKKERPTDHIPTDNSLPELADDLKLIGKAQPCITAGTSVGCATAVASFRNRRAFLLRSHDSVRRSVVALIEDNRPNSASSAPNTHSVRSNAPAASSNAPRPSIF